LGFSFDLLRLALARVGGSEERALDFLLAPGARKDLEAARAALVREEGEGGGGGGAAAAAAAWGVGATGPGAGGVGAPPSAPPAPAPQAATPQPAAPAAPSGEVERAREAAARDLAGFYGAVGDPARALHAFARTRHTNDAPCARTA
jgi:hypothetical protein